MKVNSWSKFVNTRIPHVCFGCCRTIPSSSRMVVTTTRITYTKHKRYSYVYWCDTCLSLMYDQYKPNDWFEECELGKNEYFKTYLERIEGGEVNYPLP